MGAQPTFCGTTLCCIRKVPRCELAGQQCSSIFSVASSCYQFQPWLLQMRDRCSPLLPELLLILVFIIQKKVRKIRFFFFGWMSSIFIYILYDFLFVCKSQSTICSYKVMRGPEESYELYCSMCSLVDWDIRRGKGLRTEGNSFVSSWYCILLEPMVNGSHDVYGMEWILFTMILEYPISGEIFPILVWSGFSEALP